MLEHAGWFLLDYASWWFLLHYASYLLLSIVHFLYPRIFGRPPPTNGSLAFQRHARWTSLVVVVSYCLYIFYHAAKTAELSHYQVLGVEPTADESALKIAWRHFVKRNHPDHDGSQGEENFIRVREAYEALDSSVKRRAYDVFGPAAPEFSTSSEIIAYGVTQAFQFYTDVSICILFFAVTGVMGFSVARYCYIIVAFAYVHEMLFILDPSPASASGSKLSPRLFADPTSTPRTYRDVFSLLWPGRIPYQHIRVLRTLSSHCSLALSKISPLFFRKKQPTALRFHFDKLPRISFNEVKACADTLAPRFKRRPFVDYYDNNLSGLLGFDNALSKADIEFVQRQISHIEEEVVTWTIPDGQHFLPPFQSTLC